MGVMEAFHKGNQHRCPSCINPIYAADCEIVATVDAEVPPEMVPPGIPKQSIPSRNTVMIAKGTVLKKTPAKGSLQQTVGRRMEAEQLRGELYTRTMASRTCHICGYALPANFDGTKSLTIAVVGDTTSGKSLYISALVKQLESGKLMRSDQELTFTCLTPDKQNFYINEYFTPLFKHKRRLPPNQPLAETTHDPLIYQLAVRSTKERPTKTVNLVLYDTAGEDYVVMGRLVRHTLFVLNADGIIFLADPITMPDIANRLPPGVNYDHAPGRPPTEGLNNIIFQIDRLKGRVGLHSIPIAITLSKSDLLKYLMPISGQYNFMLPHEYSGGIDLRDLDMINNDVRDFVERFGDRTLLQAAVSFKKARFFATSATGFPPDQNGIFPSIEPRRCLDPLLWILYELKIILHNRSF